MPGKTTIDTQRRVMVRKKTPSSSSSTQKPLATQPAAGSAWSHTARIESRVSPPPQPTVTSHFLPPVAMPHAPETIKLYADDAFIWYFIRNYHNLRIEQLRALWNRYIWLDRRGEQQFPTISCNGNFYTNNKLFDRYRYLFWTAIDTLKARKDWVRRTNKDIKDAARASLDDACRYSYNEAPARRGCSPFLWSNPETVRMDWHNSSELDMNKLDYEKFSCEDSVPDGFTSEMYTERLGYSDI